MTKKVLPPDNSHTLEEGFISILLGDVGSAMQRYDASQSQQHRRELIRSIFAAIEGYVWLFRNHVVEAARSLGKLELDEEIALSELSYHVSDKGKVLAQPRFVSVLAIIRLTARIATRLSPELEVRFDTADWHRLQKASAIRNRITHPKSRKDLELTGDDAVACLDAFFWLLEISTSAMEATNSALAKFNADFRAVVAELKRGNPEVWAAYHAIAGRTED